jgi:outer membrane protein OmpA-like peptidoglycan-associated protein/2-phospho-L-lactate guanylyltransferase (CobY/MobA/RfbA family)
MMRKVVLILASLLFFSSFLFSQSAVLEGYVFETGNRGFLNEVKIVILEKSSRAVRGESFTNIEGFFTLELPVENDYIVQVSKKVFKSTEVEISTKGVPSGKKVFTKVEMDRKPGYLFDVTLAERRLENEVVDAIQGSRIEVYNNTKKEEVLNFQDYQYPNFNVTFEQGNHYTVMVRKQGFFTKRMEAYVNVRGCILCFDGVGNVRPEVSDVMTRNNTMGTLLANVELDRVELDKSIQIDNIYYDLAKSDIRKDAAKELDKLLLTLKDNPGIIVELGSHTDARGKEQNNFDLSQKRAKAAVEYLVGNGIDTSRISAKGYGETKLVNKCKNGVKCSELSHQLNRRTELKITGFLDNDPYAKMSLREIIKEEVFQKMLEEVQNQEVIQIKEGEELPEEIKKAKQKRAAAIRKTNQQKIRTPAQPEVKESQSQVPVQSDLPFVESNVPKVKEITSSEQLVDTIMVGSPIGGTGKVLTGTDLEKMITGNEKTSTSKIIEEQKVGTNTVSLKLRSISPNFIGYSVEIISTLSKLSSSHELFTQYENLILEQTKEGKYAYLIGEFAEEKEAGFFLENIVAPRYSKAKVVQYSNGRRVAK